MTTLERARGIPTSSVSLSERTAASLHDVAITYHLADGSFYEAVAPTTLAIAAGEFVALVGPTGCGKSTLLNVVAGLVAPSSGICLVQGERLSGINDQAGYLFQAEALMPWKTVLANVAVGLEVQGLPRDEATERARSWLGKVGLGAFLQRYPHQLSGGQRKRVGLAQVLARDPRMLLMDEPFGPLDAQTRAIMGDLLLGLWQADRKAVLFVTHDLEEAIALADRVVIMSAGPRASIIGDFPIDLARPRDAHDVRLQPAFVDTHRAIWQVLKEEVLKGYAQANEAKA